MMIVLAFMGLGQTKVWAEPPTLEIGQPFPDIGFPSMEDGNGMSIADFRGQKVILQVFASW